MIEHNPDHPYLRRLVGCGHGRLWAEPCPECEIAGLMDEYTRAVRTVARVRDRLRVLGAPIASPATLIPPARRSRRLRRSGGAAGYDGGMAMETKRPKLSLRRRGDSVTTIGYALINECGHEIPGVIAVRDTGERDGYGTPIFDIKIAAEIVLD